MVASWSFGAACVALVSRLSEGPEAAEHLELTNP